jgi:hypothetical protein
MAATMLDEGVRIERTSASRSRSPNAGSALSALGALVCWFALIAVAAVWGRHLLDTGARLGIGAPPLFGRFEWQVSAAAWVPVAFAAGVVVIGPRMTTRLGWWRLLFVGAGLSAAWSRAFAFIDHRALFSATGPSDYLKTARSIHNPHLFLSQFVQRIHSYNTHTRGHPPGMEILLWTFARVGLGGVGWSTALSLAGGAAAGVAALVALREVADEGTARAAMPFLVLAPAAIWWSSADAFFAGVSAWAVACVILATGRSGRRSDALALVGGLLFGIAAFLSYGLVLLALLPVVVAVSRRRSRPIVLAAYGVLAVFLTFGVAGFSWFAGLAATRTQYWLGAASRRPYNYFLFADLAAFALAIGPAAVVAITRLRDRRVWLLVGGAMVAIATADLSGMSKAEVERIWLPFVPWAILATSAFVASRHERSVRFWLSLQAATAVVIQLAVRSPW